MWLIVDLSVDWVFTRTRTGRGGLFECLASIVLMSSLPIWPEDICSHYWICAGDDFLWWCCRTELSEDSRIAHVSSWERASTELLNQCREIWKALEWVIKIRWIQDNDRAGRLTLFCGHNSTPTYIWKNLKTRHKKRTWSRIKEQQEGQRYNKEMLRHFPYHTRCYLAC